MSKVVLAENKTGRSFQLRKVECLDWKKIASLDIEKIIEDSDEETLKDILPQIAFCQPEVEFDHNRTDPGFRKVFRLCQLIIQHLLLSQEVTLDRATVAETNHIAALQQNKENQNEIQRLRERLVDARKELKRRREIIESNQTEIMGGAQNKDEYDQCPYCSKKFINSIYLYSHLQRRHQGLPLHPAFPSGAVGIPAFQPQGQGGSSTTEKQTTFTQTEGGEEEGIYWKSEINHQTVNNLVEKYLTERIGYQGSLKGGPEISPASTTSIQHPVSLPEINEYEQQKTMGRMKEELEGQWRDLIEKIHKTELEDLKRTLVAEMQKMQEIMTKSGSNKSPQRAAQDKSPPLSMVGGVEKRFQKQEDELEHLKVNLQTRIRADMEVIESRLESQERFWRAKLRTVESEYQKHIGILREEFQQSLLVSNSKQNQQQQQEVEVIQRSPARVNWPPNNVMFTVKPGTATSSIENPPEDTKEESFSSSTEPEIIPIPPIPKPRSIRVLKEVNAEEEVVRVTGLPPKVPREVRTVRKEKRIPVRPTTPETNLPKVPSSSNFSTTDDDEESGSIGTYSTLPRPQKSMQTKGGLSPTAVKGQRLAAQVPTETTVMDLNFNVAGRGAKAEALQELSNQLKELGISPRDTHLPKKSMKKSLKKMKRKRQSLSEEVSAERQIQKEETRMATNTKILGTKAVVMSDTRRLNTKPVPTPSKSPFVKIFAAVKNGGSSLRRKMSSITTSKKSKVKTTPSPRKPKLASTVTTPKPGPSHRKSAPAPPPPAPVVSNGKPKKVPKMRSLFHRSVTEEKADDQESSETDEGSPIIQVSAESWPVGFSPTPLTNGNPLTAIRSTSPGSQGRKFMADENQPDEESQLITARKMDIQKKAEKEIKLSKFKVKASPDKKKALTRNISDEFGSDDEVSEKYVGKVHSSTENVADLHFDSSASSTSPSHSTASSEGETEPSIKGRQNKGQAMTSGSPKHSSGKVMTVIYHDPTRGLNEFGMKMNKPIESDDKSSTSTPPSVIGVRSLKRLQNHQQQGWIPPSALKSKVKSPPMQNEDGENSEKIKSGQESPRNSLLDAKVKSPSLPPWSISGPKSKHQDNSWDN